MHNISTWKAHIAEAFGLEVFGGFYEVETPANK